MFVMSDSKIDPLTVLPEIAAEMTAHRGLVAILHNHLKAEHCAQTTLAGMGDVIVSRLNRARDEGRRRQEFMQHATTLARCENTEEALVAWIRESAALRRSIRAGAEE
jgi:hypothetical protein